MKEMLKNKVVIGFIVLVLGISFIGGTNNKLEQNDAFDERYVAVNIQ